MATCDRATTATSRMLAGLLIGRDRRPPCRQELSFTIGERQCYTNQGILKLLALPVRHARDHAFFKFNGAVVGFAKDAHAFRSEKCATNSQILWIRPPFDVPGRFEDYQDLLSRLRTEHTCERKICPGGPRLNLHQSQDSEL